MGWATSYIQQLKAGQTVSFRPRGNSMAGRVESGQLVTVRPLAQGEHLKKDDIVLCKVHGAEYLHLVKAIGADQVQIGNNRGGINGWTPVKNVYGVCVSVEP